MTTTKKTDNEYLIDSERALAPSLRASIAGCRKDIARLNTPENDAFGWMIEELEDKFGHGTVGEHSGEFYFGSIRAGYSACALAVRVTSSKHAKWWLSYLKLHYGYVVRSYKDDPPLSRDYKMELKDKTHSFTLYIYFGDPYGENPESSVCRFVETGTRQVEAHEVSIYTLECDGEEVPTE